MALPPDQCRTWLAASRCPVNRFDRSPAPFGGLLVAGVVLAAAAWVLVTGRA